ncbi:MAG TPA: DUF488 family protein [Acidimicrobiales bacterium]|nr:DUF488 family protein [Acidimicrobiales bacterium]
MAGHSVRIRRAYDEPGGRDGARVLVDRIWPRGVTKEQAALDEWMKDVAPSTALRKWYGHDPERYGEFRRRYRRELSSGAGAEALGRLRDLRGKRAVTLVTATKDVDISGAKVLAELLTGSSR